MSSPHELSLTHGDHPVEPASGVDCAAVSAKWFQLSDGVPYEYEMESDRNYLALHDITQEEGELVVEGVAQPRKRDLRRLITYLPANMPVRGWAKPTTRRNGFTAIYFDDAAIPEPLKRSFSGWTEPNAHFRAPEVERSIRKLELALKRDDPFVGLLAESILITALTELVQGRTRRATPHPGQPLASSTVRQVRDYMSENIQTQLSLDALASSVGLSKFHFARAFKAATGKSPYKEVLDLRVASAGDLLQEGVPIAKVAQLTGFNGVAQFSRSFRRITGLSPSEFKLKHR